MFGVATMWRSLAGLFIRASAPALRGPRFRRRRLSSPTARRRTSAPGDGPDRRGLCAWASPWGRCWGARRLFGGEAADQSLARFPGRGTVGGLALVLAIFRLPESLHATAKARRAACSIGAALRAALSRPSIGLLLVASFVAVFSFANFESTLSLQIKQMVDVEQRPIGHEMAQRSGRRHPIPRRGRSRSRPRPFGRVIRPRWRSTRALGTDRPGTDMYVVRRVGHVRLPGDHSHARARVSRPRLSGGFSEGAMATGGAVTAIAGFVLLALAAQRE